MNTETTLEIGRAWLDDRERCLDIRKAIVGVPKRWIVEGDAAASKGFGPEVADGRCISIAPARLAWPTPPFR